LKNGLRIRLLREKVHLRGMVTSGDHLQDVTTDKYLPVSRVVLMGCVALVRSPWDYDVYAENLFLDE